MTKLQAEIPDDDYDALKLIALTRKINLYELVSEIVAKYLKEQDAN